MSLIDFDLSFFLVNEKLGLRGIEFSLEESSLDSINDPSFEGSSLDSSFPKEGEGSPAGDFLISEKLSTDNAFGISASGSGGNLLVTFGRVVGGFSSASSDAVEGNCSKFVMGLLTTIPGTKFGD